MLPFLDDGAHGHRDGGSHQPGCRRIVALSSDMWVHLVLCGTPDNCCASAPEPCKTVQRRPVPKKAVLPAKDRCHSIAFSLHQVYNRLL